MIDIEFSEVKHRVMSQDYIIIGKQSKETEVKIHFDSSDLIGMKHRIENAMRGVAYGEHLYHGGAKGSDAQWEKEVKDGNDEKVSTSA